MMKIHHSDEIIIEIYCLDDDLLKWWKSSFKWIWDQIIGGLDEEKDRKRYGMSKHGFDFPLTINECSLELFWNAIHYL